ncbi:MFS transporter [Notoacmeibacter marinus]|uniref:MFS transporter n=1 Tax=Notoacmeibacter marinus TaxID=1876515 RepID=UPI001963A2CF|nr:MFS transporter [Notoacmeibacter marinus]
MFRQPMCPAMNVFAGLGSLVVEDEANRVCRDIPEGACAPQPRNAGLHIASLTATKAGDALIDPKLVLPWLLNAVGAPAAAIGLLVPLRESLALLPQLFTSHRVRRLAQRKWVWAFGSAIEAVAVAAMAATLFAFEGALAGWLTVAWLAVFALGRSLASVSYKDVLGKTISKGRRGSVTGLAGSAAAAFALAFGVSLTFGILPLEKPVLLGALVVAALLWAVAAFLFTLLHEEAGANEGAVDGLAAIANSARALWADRQFRLFCAMRGLLTVTALAPPYLLLSAGEGGSRALGQLGSFLLASAFAAIAGSYVWGRLSDRSSRWVLLLSAASAATVLGVAAAFSAFQPLNDLWPLMAPFAFFLLQIAYQGVRQGRNTHLTDMAPAEDRAVYTAFSNTFIGIVLLAMGGFGLVADWLGTPAVLALFALLALAALPVGWQLDEVQRQ